MSNIIGFSKGLYSSWFYHAPSRSLFDCGEGCASFLGNKVNAVQNIYLSHDHNDHIAGLLTFIAARESGMMATVEVNGEQVGKPLNIFFPSDSNSHIPALAKFIQSTFPRLSFDLKWIPVLTGALPNNVIAFQTNHYKKLSLGYKVAEFRKRLKKEYQGQDIPALLRSKAVDRANLNEEYMANSFVYMLDSNAYIDRDDIKGADVLIADTTFLSVKDRTGGNTHATLHEAILLGMRANVKTILCAHFSPRYTDSQINEAVTECIKRYGNHINIGYVSPQRLFNY